MTDMTPTRPYLIRALHEWITDNGLTPYLVVDASDPGAQVPAELVEGGKVIFNVSDSAVYALCLGNDMIEFRARFGSRPTDVAFRGSS